MSVERVRKYIAVFKRLEKDAEFRNRIRREMKVDVSTSREGKALDDWAWEAHKMQRRIIEDVSEAR